MSMSCMIAIARSPPPLSFPIWHWALLACSQSARKHAGSSMPRLHTQVILWERRNPSGSTKTLPMSKTGSESKTLSPSMLLSVHASMSTGFTRVDLSWERRLRFPSQLVQGCRCQAARNPSSTPSICLNLSMDQSTKRMPSARQLATGTLRFAAWPWQSSESSTRTLLILSQSASSVLPASEQLRQPLSPHMNLWKAPWSNWRQETFKKVSCTHISSNQKKYDMQPLYQLRSPKRANSDGATRSGLV